MGGSPQNSTPMGRKDEAGNSGGIRESGLRETDSEGCISRGQGPCGEMPLSAEGGPPGT